MTEHYVVSARKYRPDTFRSIVGQEAMASTLRTAVRSGKLSHAYLFCGPRGVGKTTAARVLARTINCENLSAEGEACGQCESCKAFEEQRSFNIFELDAASNNSVEDIRQLTEQVQMPPALGRYKVYIIDEVHMLSAAAFNAFLKTLEEPPSYAIFILATTEKHKILPTILSRCQIYDFKRITVQDITRHLRYVADSEGIDAEETALGLIAEKADGGMRDALSMFDRIASFAGGHITYQHALESLNVLDYTYFIRIFELFLSGDHRSVLLLLDELMGKGFEGQTILTGLSAFVRDLLVAQHPETLQLLEKPDAVAASYATTASLAVITLVGVCLGFLWFNYHPSSIMMGGGSETMGLVLASAGIIVTGQVDPSLLGSQQLIVSLLPLLLPISVILVPIGDLVVTSVRRMLRGKSPFHADRSHFHDRLLERGHSHRGVVAILWMWTALVAFPPVALLTYDWRVVALCTLPALFIGMRFTASEFPTYSLLFGRGPRRRRERRKTQ